MSKVYILIVNWNGWKDTIECLESVFRNVHPNYRVIVCDNGSADGSVEAVKAWAAGDLDTWVPKDHALRRLAHPPVSKPIPVVEHDRSRAEAGGDPAEDDFRLVLIMGDWIRHGGWGFTPLPRFFRRGKVHFTETVHQYIRKDNGARTLRLPPEAESCILHFNDRDASHFVEKPNRYTEIEAQHLFDRGIRFSYRRMLWASMREFLGRYLKGKGYRDGTRGFSLCLMMAFCRALSFITLWEEHAFADDPVAARYERMRSRILAEWKGEPA